jgi:hypothetical protein
VIRNVSIHVSGEQPLLADLFDIPTAADAGLLCTNVRMLDGKRPVFIDQIGATFFFPYHVVRFIEIPAGALDEHVATSADGRAPGGRAAGRRARRDNGQPDGESAVSTADLRLPVPVAHPDGTEADAEPDLEIDEGFLQRIRDI